MVRGKADDEHYNYKYDCIDGFFVYPRLFSQWIFLGCLKKFAADLRVAKQYNPQGNKVPY